MWHVGRIHADIHASLFWQVMWAVYMRTIMPLYYKACGPYTCGQPCLFTITRHVGRIHADNHASLLLQGMWAVYMRTIMPLYNDKTCGPYTCGQPCLFTMTRHVGCGLYTCGQSCLFIMTRHVGLFIMTRHVGRMHADNYAALLWKGMWAVYMRTIMPLEYYDKACGMWAIYMWTIMSLYNDKACGPYTCGQSCLFIMTRHVGRIHLDNHASL